MPFAYPSIVLLRLCIVACLFASACWASVAAQAPIEIPFQYRDGFIWVQVQVGNEAEPANFLLDSGANVSTLNLGAARRFKLRGAQPVTVRGVHSRRTGYWPVRLEASLGAAPLPGRFLAVDLGALQEQCRCDLDGLIGADFFANQIVQIDFRERKIRLLNSSPTQTNSVPLRLRNGAIQMPARVNAGPDQWMRLDTGCATALEWVSGRQGSPAQVYTHVVGLASISVPQNQCEVQIGVNRLGKVLTGQHHAPIFPGEAGLVGNGLLAHFEVVTVDLQAGWLFLGP